MIGILIVAHGAFGEAIIHSASHVLGKRPLYLRQLGITVHDEPEAVANMSCLPEHLDGRRYYEPTDRGVEARFKDALAKARELRKKPAKSGSP